MKLTLIIAGAAAALLVQSQLKSFAKDLPTFGYLEDVGVGPNSLIMKAKLDTGADTSSLGYHKITHFEKNGAQWVRFSVRNFEGKSFALVRKVIRNPRIRRHGASSIKRPVVRVSLCLGDIQKVTEVSLANRSKFSTQVLVGRSFLAGAVLVDSAKSNTKKPECKQGRKQ